MIQLDPGLNQRWSLDFVADELANGRRFRVLTVIDLHSRECLALEADVSLPAARVALTLDMVTSPSVAIVPTQVPSLSPASF